MFKFLTATLVFFAKGEVDLGQETEEEKIDRLFGLHPNELYFENKNTNFNKYHFEKEEFNLMALLDRHNKFQTPPHSM